MPAIEIVPPADPAPLEAAARRLAELRLGALHERQRRRTALSRAPASRTRRARVRRGEDRRHRSEDGGRARTHGVRADRMADEYVGEGLARDMLALGPPRRVLIAARARRARRAAGAAARSGRGGRRRGGLRDAPGARGSEPSSSSSRGEVDTVLFTSSSTVKTTVERLGASRDELSCV